MFTLHKSSESNIGCKYCKEITHNWFENKITFLDLLFASLIIWAEDKNLKLINLLLEGSHGIGDLAIVPPSGQYRDLNKLQRFEIGDYFLSSVGSTCQWMVTDCPRLFRQAANWFFSTKTQISWRLQEI